MATIDELIVRLDATTEGLRRELRRADSQVGGFQRTVDKRLARVEGRFIAMGRTVTRSLGAVGLAFGGLEVARGFEDAANAATKIENRLRTVTDSAGQLTDAYNRLYASSQANSVEFLASVELFARMSRALRSMGVEQNKVIDLTDTLQKAVRLSGASATEAAGALIQFSQGLQSGQLAGDEFRAIAEQMPSLLDAIAREIAKTDGISFQQARDSLKQLASEGRITRDVMVDAISNMREQVVAEFENVARSSEDSKQRLRNAVVDMSRALERATGVATSFGGAIDAIADSVSDLADDLNNNRGEITWWVNRLKELLDLSNQYFDFRRRVAEAFGRGLTGGEGPSAEALIQDRRGGEREGGTGARAPGDGPVVDVTTPTVPPATAKPASPAGTARAARGYSKATEEAVTVSEEFNRVLRDVEDSLTEGKRVFDETRTPLERYSAEVENLNSLYREDGVISADTYARAIEGAQEKLRSATERSNDAVRDLGLTFTSALEDAVFNIGEATSALDILKGALDDIARILFRKNITEPLADAISSIDLGGIFGGGSSSGGSGGGGIFGSIGKFIGSFLADGGQVSGPGSGTSDSVPAMLSRGEYVVNAAATQRYLPMLEAINKGARIPRLATGGLVSASSPAGTKLGDSYTYYIDAKGADREGLARREGVVQRLGGEVRRIDLTLEPRATAAVARSVHSSSTYRGRIRG